MKYIYTATFESGKDGTIYARIPDLAGCITTGKDLNDAIEQITDAASGWLVVAEDEGLEIPEATPQDKIKRDPDTDLSFIRIDTISYRIATDSRSVRKNVSIPSWMASMADRKGLNCSQLLQDALKKVFEAQN